MGRPETLQGVVAARIDSLPADEKELLQQASVLGKVFWTDALAAHFDGDAWVLEERLHALERKEFVRREHRSAVEGAKQYTFVHALVRDGAYGQMPRAARARAHERIAEWIASLPSDRAEDRAEMLAHHLVEAVEFGRAAGLDVSALTLRAAEAAQDAGDRSWALGAPGAALASYERARSLDPTLAEDPYLLLRLGHALLLVHQRGEDELDHAASALAASDPAAAAEAVIIRGEGVWQRGDQVSAFAYFERAAAMVEDLPASRRKLLVTTQVARFLTLAGRADEGLEHAERAIAMARELGDDELLGDSLNNRGIARSALGDPGALADIEQSLALALELNSWRASRAYTNLGSVLASDHGDIRRADATLREGVEFDERLGLRLLLRWLKGNLAETTFHLGLWEEALELAEGEIGDPEPHYQQQLCRNVRAWIRLARDDVRGARDDVDLALRDARQIRDPQALVPALTASAFFAAATGETARANQAIDELDTTLVEVGLRPLASPEAGSSSWRSRCSSWDENVSSRARSSGRRHRGATRPRRSRTTSSFAAPTRSPSSARSRGRRRHDSGRHGGSRHGACSRTPRPSSRPRWRSTASSVRREQCGRARRCSQPPADPAPAAPATR